MQNIASGQTRDLTLTDDLNSDRIQVREPHTRDVDFPQEARKMHGPTMRGGDVPVAAPCAIREEPSSGRDNNFNLLRMAAATAVLVSHAFPLARGTGAAEPLQQSIGMSLGTLAVYSFFLISGYFISQSFQRRRDLLEFTIARILRIYPGLLVALTLTVLIIGPAFTNLPLSVYFLEPATLLYIPLNLTLARLQYELPGVFGNNPFGGAINGSLWTLAYEVACYAMVAAVGLCGLAANGRRFAGFLIGYAALYLLIAVVGPHFWQVEMLHNLSLPFVCGMVFFQYRKHIPFRPHLLIAAGLAAFLSLGRPWFSMAFGFAWSYGLFYIGFLKVRPLLVYNRFGDYSYGMYIYAFPVEQAMAALARGCTPWALMAWAALPTLGLAILSWHLIEYHALAQRAVVTTFLKLNRSASPGSVAETKLRTANTTAPNTRG
jgi:peptidoglycan/LPS O-acetylase OafA/YrhL